MALKFEKIRSVEPAPSDPPVRSVEPAAIESVGRRRHRGLQHRPCQACGRGRGRRCGRRQGRHAQAASLHRRDDQGDHAAQEVVEHRLWRAVVFAARAPGGDEDVAGHDLDQRHPARGGSREEGGLARLAVEEQAPVPRGCARWRVVESQNQVGGSGRRLELPNAVRHGDGGEQVALSRMGARLVRARHIGKALRLCALPARSIDRRIEPRYLPESVDQVEMPSPKRGGTDSQRQFHA